MRITVISDSHRNTNAIRKILNAENGGDTVFFLGDVTADIEEVMHEYPNKTFNIVSGNCDFFFRLSGKRRCKCGRSQHFLHPRAHAFGKIRNRKAYRRRKGKKLRYSALRAHPYLKNII